MSEPTSSIPASDAPRKPRRGFRIPAPLAAILVILLLLAGAWVVYDQLFRVKPINLADYEAPDSPTAAMRGRFFEDGAGVGATARDNWVEATIIGARVRCTFEEGKPPQVTVLYTNLRGPEWQSFRVRYAAISDKDEQARAKVTPEQVAKLRAVPFPRDAVLSDADKKTLIDLCAAYRQAPDDKRKAIETKLIAALRPIAAAGVSGTLAAQAEAGKQIREILTPEQISALRPRRAR